MKKIYFAVLTVICTNFYAQTKRDSINEMDEVIINENRFSTPISKQNRNVYVITSEIIKAMPARTLQEVLQYANGVDIRQRGPFGGQADVSVDGGSFEQTVVLLNGAKVIDSQTAHNMLNLPLPVEVIERIEVIRGPAARVFGINSLTGAINIITKKPTDSGVLISTYAGSNFEKNTEGDGDTFYGTGIQAGVVLGKEKQQHSIFASHDKSNGYRYNTAFENNKIFYQGNVQLNDANEISGSAGYINNGFGANGFYAAPTDRNATEIVQTTFANLQSKHSITDSWNIMPRVTYRYNYDDYRYMGNSNLNVGRSQHYTNSIAAELNSTVKLSRGEIGFGGEFRNENIHSSNIGDHDRENVGLYAEYRTSFSEKLNVNVGTYLNYNSDYKWQIYPGIDASYEITDSFKIIGNVGTSQRIPSFTDLYLKQTGNIGNTDLDSENAFQSEIGFKFSKKALTFNANYFYRKITNYIDWMRNATTVPWQSQNTGDLNTNGINLRGTYRIDFSADSRLNINLGYSYLDSDFKSNRTEIYSKYLISSLKHQITNTINYQYKDLSILFATRFNERITGPSYWINDFRVSQSIHKFNIFLDAQNIFNATYYEVGAIPLPSRWFSLGVKFVTF
ncbi:TonB-dependent receptor plug domain-containing protein [Flavobacterium gelatinilyticum]|uniref:TonB-dependent receptor plug domain-containing protein n=1 Tax=Flavobacterium gelatinilyticum TaxID=3003260 RepID=UPI00247FCB3C|nr:TonB-dependent receptor [Flavobacterium gelatinilyticum]